MIRHIIAGLLLFASCILHAEGTRELRPQESHYGSPILLNHPDYTRFGQYDAADNQQIKVRIGSTNEVIYFGLNNHTKAGGFLELPYRWISPSGTVVYEGIMQQEGIGCINSWIEAVEGPSQILSEGGYNALMLEPTETGDYVIEFNLALFPEEEVYLHLFDITVANVHNQAIPGRLHCKGWQLSTEGQNHEFHGKVYPYTENGVIYEIDLNRMQPFTFIIYVNSSGLQDTGDFFEDRKSRVGNYALPEYKVFLNPPDELLYPTQDIRAHLTSSIKKKSCPGTNYCINYTASTKGHLEGFIDINLDGRYDKYTDIHFFKIMKEGESICIEWDGKDLQGNPVEGNKFKVYTSFGYGITNLPLYDVEHHLHGYKVKIIRPAGYEPPLLFWDDEKIVDGETVGGEPLINLTGCISIPDGCHRWKDRGAIEGPRHRQETINTWWYVNTLHDTLSINFSEKYPVMDQSWQETLSPSYTLHENNCNEPVSVIFENTEQSNTSLTFILQNDAGEEFHSSENIAEVMEGNYSLIVTDNGSCTQAFRNYISVPRPFGCDQAFSPNGDGISDTYYISTPGTARIYNKQGMLIKEIQTPAEWDGTDTQGNLSKSGLYAIVVNEHVVMHVSLIR
ncbi:MAG: gliding motility-associated C-terminal domain-containing protein [Cytophagaceae bacterium]